MKILKLLDNSSVVYSYEIKDFKTFSDGFYIKIEAVLKNKTLLFIREYFDNNERKYSYHWQDTNGNLIMRWDNAPHHNNLKTFPHHIHKGNKIYENYHIHIEDVLEIIKKNLS